MRPLPIVYSLIDAWLCRFIRAAWFAILGPTRRRACVALFAALSIGCGSSAAARTVPDGSDDALDGSSGGESAIVRAEDYTLAEAGVFVRTGELDGIYFLEVVIGTDDPTASLPLLVVIHGLGDDPAIPVGPYRGLSRPVRIVLPRGPLSVREGFGWMSVRVGDEEVDTLSSEIDTQTERLASFLASLVRERPTRGGTVLIGFSQGGMLTLSLATRHPELVGLALPLAGWLPPALRIDAVAGSPRFMWMHGTSDERIPFALAEEATHDLVARGFDVTLLPYEGQGHSMNEEMDVDFHAWLERILENLERGRALGDGLPLP